MLKDVLEKSLFSLSWEDKLVQSWNHFAGGSFECPAKKLAQLCLFLLRLVCKTVLIHSFARPNKEKM